MTMAHLELDQDASDYTPVESCAYDSSRGYCTSDYSTSDLSNI